MTERPAIDRRRTDDERLKVCRRIGRRIRCGPKAEARCTFCEPTPTREECVRRFQDVILRRQREPEDLH